MVTLEELSKLGRFALAAKVLEALDPFLKSGDMLDWNGSNPTSPTRTHIAG